jgi:hypothetical protein
MEMRRQPGSESWSRYLEAERSGREEEAELLLLELFTALPQAVPAAGFAGRILARIGPAARRSLLSHRSVRLALAASLIVAGVGAALVAPMVPPLAALVGPGRLLGGIVSLVSSLAVRFASGVAVWEQVGAIVGTLARAAANPTVAALLLFNLLLAAGALRGLAVLASGLESKEGSPDHVVS